MKKLHLALSTNNIAGSVEEYTKRLGAEPCAYIDNEYALWRTQSLNVSIRQDLDCATGELRHLGWEDPNAVEFSDDTDINGIIWECFTAEQQADEINELWPEADYHPT